MPQCSMIALLKTVCYIAAAAPKSIACQRIRAAAVAVAGLSLAGYLPAQAQDSTLTIVKIADGTYVHFGKVALTTPENAGDIVNLGIVVGHDAAAVIDTGGSIAIG